jgi:conjugal transfer pilin signal peptidase TrbI
MPMNFDLKKIEEFFKTHLQIIVIVLIVTFGFCFFMPKQQKIAFFDLKTTYALFLKEASVNHLTKEKQSILSKNFPIAVNNAVENYAVKHHAVVFVSSAVMAGAIDATQEIQDLIAKEMYQLTQSKKNR